MSTRVRPLAGVLPPGGTSSIFIDRAAPVHQSECAEVAGCGDVLIGWSGGMGGLGRVSRARSCAPSGIRTPRSAVREALEAMGMDAAVGMAIYRKTFPELFPNM